MTRAVENGGEGLLKRYLLFPTYSKDTALLLSVRSSSTCYVRKNPPIPVGNYVSARGCGHSQKR